MPNIVHVDNIVNGMRLCRDVEVRGTILLAAGTVLAEPHVRLLKKWGIHNVGVTEPETPGAPAAATDRKSDDPGVQAELDRIGKLFATGSDDKQTQMLKTALLCYIEDNYRASN